MPDTAVDQIRLSRAVVPSRYELELEPDLDAATFRGTETVTVDVTEPASELVLNAAELEIDEAWAEAGDLRLDAKVSDDPDQERARLAFDQPLPSGPARLHLAFRGQLNDKLRGFYRSTFTDQDGRERVIATTQMESTDARRAFPCWDEPDFKATFAVTLVVPDDLMALSNGAEVSREAAGDGKVRVTFADTMVMSTYLVAFVVGPLEATKTVDVDGVPLRVVAPKGQTGLADFALEVGASALRFFADYFGIGYPGDKVDLVAVPDFAFGAMENLGCITFRDNALLVDTAQATQVDLDRVAEVVAHELAHMWFGDLVTMKWWNGIWLNEAFATFMAALAVDHFRPEWQTWTNFALSRSAAYDIDALSTTRPIEYPVVTPTDAEGMFDVLTYEKGCSVVRMLEQYVGAEPFREGIRRYIAAHAYANTETTDLWDALEASTGEPVRRIADSWIFQGGHPEVGVELVDGGRALRLHQHRFRYLAGDDDQRWAVPALLRVGDATSTTEERHLVEGDESTVRLDPPAGWALANAGGQGFYRVRYQPDALADLAEHAQERLSAVERYTLVDDAWASVTAGATSVADFLPVARAFRDETDLSVWRRLVGTLGGMRRICPQPTVPKLGALVRDLIADRLEALGDEPSKGEPERTTTLRAVLFEAMGTLGEDPGVLARADELERRQADQPGSVNAELVDAAIRVLAPGGDAERFETFWKRSQAATTPQYRLRYLGAMGDFEDADLFDRYCQLLDSDQVRTQDAGPMFLRAMANRVCGPRAWRYVTDHWDELHAKLPHNLSGRLVGGIRTFTDRALADEVEAFLADHPLPQAATQIPQFIERMRVSVALAEREGPRLADALG